MSSGYEAKARFPKTWYSEEEPWESRVTYDPEESMVIEIAEELLTSAKPSAIPTRSSRNRSMTFTLEMAKWLHEHLGKAIVACEAEGGDRDDEFVKKEGGSDGTGDGDVEAGQGLGEGPEKESAR